LLNKQTKSINHPPLVLRERILNKYNEDLNNLDHIDAYISYTISMHKIYVKYNPWLARNKYGKPWRPKTRKDFSPKEQDFDQ
jgi:hypothetical protein